MSNNRRRGPMGGPGRGMAPGEKAKDLKGTMVKLIKYMRRFYVPIVMVIIFAIASTVFNTCWTNDLREMQQLRSSKDWFAKYLVEVELILIKLKHIFIDVV